MCINALEHAVQNFAAIFSVFFFLWNFKDPQGDPVYSDLQITSEFGAKEMENSNINHDLI